MESVFTQKAARVLRVLMLIALGCNLIALFLVPTAVLVNGEVCTQRGKKLRPGDIVTTPDIPDMAFEVAAGGDQ